MKDIYLIKEYGLSGYYLDLKSFIREFVDNNYPLSIADNAAILNGLKTERIVARQYVRNLLNGIVEEVLQNEIARRKEDLNKTYQFDSPSEQDKKLLELKKEVLSILQTKFVRTTSTRLKP